MVEHDGQVGQLLKKLDDLGIADNTIVIYTTDNGAEVFSWPDGGTTPFRGEKNTNWEGGYRVPALIRWPGVVSRAPRSTRSSRPRIGRRPWSPRPASPTIKKKLLQGYEAAGKTFKVHLDGYDQRDLLAGKGPDKRHEFFYWTDDGNLAGLRYDQWKAVFLEQRAEGLDVWAEPLVQLGCHGCSICAPTHSSGLSMRQEIMCAGLSSMHSFCFRRRSWSDSTFRASANSHPASVLARSRVEQAMEMLRAPPSSN